MNIAWLYLDKRNAAINALKDYEGITRIEAILFYIYSNNNVCAGIPKAQTTNNSVKERRYYYEFKLDGRYRQRRKTVLQKVAKQICGLLGTVC